MTPPLVHSVPQVRSLRLRAAHGDLAALQAGPDSQPPWATALLVPGFTGSKEDFLAVLPAFAAAGVAATSIDQRGQHQSPWGPRESYAFDRLAADITAVAASLPGPVHLVGHSLGGLVARRAVLAEPGAFASLTLMSSGPAGIVGNRRDELQRLLVELADTDVETLFNQQQERDRAAGLPERPAALTAFLRARALATCPTGLARMGEQLRDEPDLVQELQATGIRSLVLYGEDDNAWPPALQDQMAERLGAACARIGDAAHSPAAEAPVRTAAALVDFWSSAS